jgi:hypothetical protein
MKANKNRTRVITGATTAILGMALISLVSCSSGESSSNTVAPGGSAGLSGPMVFVNNTGDKTLTSVALKGDSGNAVVGTIPSAEFEGGALGDMQFSEGAAHKVATIDPLTQATPVHEVNLTAGTRPVHIYRDPTDGEIMWVMNDGDNAVGTLTPGDDVINCNNPGRVGGAVLGSSVTILHNSHLGPGAAPPTVIKSECILADGHKVAAFSQPTTNNANIQKLAFVSSSTAGEIAVIGNDPAIAATYHKLITRIDLCDQIKEDARATPAVCDVETSTPLTTPFTVNNSNPHGIRFSKTTGKVYSIQENYRTIVEIDPTTLAVTVVADLSTTNYTAYGISPDGRFLLLRGDTTSATGTKLGVIDLDKAGNPLTNFTIPELAGTSPGSFKFSPDGKRFYILAGNAATATKKDRLFAFDASTLIPIAPATEPALTLLPNGEILLLGTGAHSLDVLAQGSTGQGEAQYIVVSNAGTPVGSVSIINAADNQIKQSVNVGPAPGAVMIYYPGAAAAKNQASS